MGIVARGMVAGIFLAGAAVGLAGPASAQPLEGAYTVTVTSTNAPFAGPPYNVTFTPCGTECTRMVNVGGKVAELHLQGNAWTGNLAYTYGGANCVNVYTFDKDSLVGTEVDEPCASLPRFESNIALAKTG